MGSVYTLPANYVPCSQKVYTRDAATLDRTQGHSEIDRTCCLSRSGFVEVTGKCLPKKQECKRKNDKESSTHDPFRYDPAIYPKLRQHCSSLFIILITHTGPTGPHSDKSPQNIQVSSMPASVACLVPRDVSRDEAQHSYASTI